MRTGAQVAQPDCAVKVRIQYTYYHQLAVIREWLDLEKLNKKEESWSE